MPEANALEAGSGRGFYPVLEIIGAYFAIAGEYPGGCPEQIHQLDVIIHLGILPCGLA
jgi:hypothetical protein